MLFEETAFHRQGPRTSIVLKFPLRDAQGQIYAIGGMVTDITERKQAEEEVIKQKEILQKIFDFVPAMINFIDEHGHIQLVNREWERVLGWSLKEIQEKNIDILAETYPDPAYRREVLQFVSESNGEWHDFKTRLRDGRVIDTTWALIRLSDGTFIGIGQDITERKRAEEELRQSREQLRALAGYLESAREEERSRMARELHDDIAQALTGIKLSLEIHTREQTERAGSPVTHALAVTNELMGKVRDLSLELRPAMLDDFGLLAALRWHLDRYTSECKIRVNFNQTGLEARRFHREIETAAYRIVEEALSNVARQPGVDKADVSVSADDNALCIRIGDLGRGFDAESPWGGSTRGPSGIRERVYLLGGHLTVDSAGGAGTVLTAELPLITKSDPHPDRAKVPK
jgi:PAS domain S-box-containing protein